MVAWSQCLNVWGMKRCRAVFLGNAQQSQLIPPNSRSLFGPPHPIVFVSFCTGFPGFITAAAGMEGAQQAATYYKANQKWEEAGNAYLRAQECAAKLKYERVIPHGWGSTGWR